LLTLLSTLVASCVFVAQTGVAAQSSPLLHTTNANSPLAAPAKQSGLTLNAYAGFDGYYKVNRWLPVQVVVANAGPDIEGEIQIAMTGGGRGASIYTQPAVLPTQSRKQFTLHVFLENYARELTVKLVEKRKTLAEHNVRIQQSTSDDVLCGVISRDGPAALNYLGGLSLGGPGRIYVAHLSLADIPAKGPALDGLDVLILHDADTSSLSEAQRDALRAWVAAGGHLIITGGPNAIPTAAGLGDLLPVQVNGTVTSTDIGVLGDYVQNPFIVNVPAVVAHDHRADDGGQGCSPPAGTPRPGRRTH
jgi:hypothetical protein